MIAEHGFVMQAPHQPDDVLGIGSVPDHIAKTDYPVRPLPLNVCLNSLECLKVAMNIGENRQSHCSPYVFIWVASAGPPGMQILSLEQMALSWQAFYRRIAIINLAPGWAALQIPTDWS